MNCVICKSIIDDKNISKEHIIPNCLGGKLKSSEILCSDCNSKLGSSIDSALSNNFNKYMTLFGFKRERGSNQKVELNSMDCNEKYYLYDDHLEMSKPEVSIDKCKNSIKYKIKGRSKKETCDILKGIYKKYGDKGNNSEIDEVMDKLEIRSENLNKRVSIGLDFGGHDFYRAIGKIALCFYALYFDDYENLDDLVNYVNKKILPKTNIVTMYYAQTNKKNWDNNSIYHYIGIKNIAGWVIGYIELFSTFKFIIKIKKNNDDTVKIRKDYYEWLTEIKDIEGDIFPNISDIDAAFSNEVFDYLDEFKTELNGLMRKAYKALKRRELNQKIKRTIYKVKEKNKDEKYFTEEIIREIINEIVKNLNK